MARDREEVRDWLVQYLAGLLAMAPNEVDIDRPVQRYGLDSQAAVELTGHLADWLGEDVDPTVVFEHLTIRSLADHIGG